MKTRVQFSERLCECGCGTVLPSPSKGRRTIRFISGHNSRLKTSVDRFWGKVTKSDGCWLWNGAEGAHGYGSINYGGKHYRPSQLSYTLHHGTIPQGFEILHTCDTPKCVRPDHLLLGTHADNMRDMTIKGRNGFKVKPGSIVRGDRHPARIKKLRNSPSVEHI
ncbi:MAG: HNH endonuclease [Chloroflexi bacterium]|nr:HNH endonuclease [Chloroflexota bacterium]